MTTAGTTTKMRAWAAVLLLPLSAAACGSVSEPEAQVGDQAPVPVQVGLSRRTMAPSVFEAGGVLTARETAVVSSRVLAPITRVAVSPGERVRQGQVLVELDAGAVTAEAERSRASLAGARAEARVAASDQAAAEAAVTLARVTHDRISRLQAERSATAQELDEAAAALKEAEARLAMTVAQREASSRAIEAAAAAARAADITQSWSRLAAPFDGMVAARHADPGTMAVPGQPLLTLEKAGGLQLEARIDASQASGLTIGESVEVRVDDGVASGWTPGRIAEIARVDPASHSFVVTVDVEASAAWRSGLFGRARFSSRAVDRLTVPVDAVVTRGQLTFAYVVGADDLARLRMVSLGEVAADRIEVLAGLSDGELVVLRPAATLPDGARVRAVQAPAGVSR